MVKGFQVLLCITNNSISHFFYTQWSNSPISNNSIQHKSFVCIQFKCQTVLFDQSGATTLSQSGAGSDCNEGIIHNPQSSKTLVCWGSYSFAKIQSAYSTAPAE